MAGQGRAQGQVGTWPRPGIAGAAAPWLVPVTGLAGPLAAKLREWAAVEVAPGRLMPWLPVAFGTGIACYFTAEREPVWWVAAALAAGVTAIAVLLRTRASFPVALGCAAVAAGFATAAIKACIVDHAVLRATAYSVAVSGFVESREERERSDRIVVRVTGMEGARLTDRPERIRLTVRKGRAPAVGSFVAMKARLNPPTSPLRPGGYDLARDLYFQGIGAAGLAAAVHHRRRSDPRRHRRPHPRGDTRRRRRHCFRPHHRQTRRAHRQRVRCHVHFRRRPCAVGLGYHINPMVSSGHEQSGSVTTLEII
jgi:competence protein ComEC